MFQQIEPIKGVERIERVIYQTDIMQWKVILFDVSDKHCRKLICETERDTRYEAEGFAKMMEDKLLCDLEQTDI